MSCSGVIGGVFERRAEVNFEWTIPEFASLKANAGDYFDSPAFLVSNSSWHLRMYPYGFNVTGWVSLYLHKEDSDEDEKCVTFTLGMKGDPTTAAFGSVVSYSTDEVESTQTFRRGQSAYGRQKFKSRSTLPDKVVFTCRIKDSSPPLLEVPQQPMKLMELQTLSSNLRDLYMSKTRYDATLSVNDRQFQVHRAVLMVRSRVFAAMFEHDMLEGETGLVRIEDCDPDSFGDFLQYLYTGKLEQISFRTAYHLYVTADKYQVEELKTFCVTFMMRNFTAENVCDVFTMAERYGDTGLLSAAQTFFDQNATKVLSTAQWEALLRENCLLANKIFKEMASKVTVKE